LTNNLPEPVHMLAALLKRLNAVNPRTCRKQHTPIAAVPFVIPGAPNPITQYRGIMQKHTGRWSVLMPNRWRRSSTQ